LKLSVQSSQAASDEEWDRQLALTAILERGKQ
jgi:hypothetical protein